MCSGVDSPASVVDEGPFSRGRWLHSHPKNEREEGGAGEKWQIIFKKSDVFVFFFVNFRMGPSVILGIHYHKNSAAVLKSQH